MVGRNYPRGDLRRWPSFVEAGPTIYSPKNPDYRTVITLGINPVPECTEALARGGALRQ